MVSYDLETFSMRDMTELGARLRNSHEGARTMEEAGRRIAQLARDSLATESGTSQIVLSRVYKTHPYAELPSDLKRFARGLTGDKEPGESTRCLTLLATAGARAEWNDRHASRGHQAIPLLSEEIVREAPMIATLIQQLGLPISAVLRPDPALMLDLAARSYNVFHVPSAPGSPHIPAQDFVRENRVRSALGIGGMLPSGNLFALILFSNVTIPTNTAQLFRGLALNVKLALLPFDGGDVFEGTP